MVGIFDSGIGGLSVLRALRVKAPHMDIVYFGDTENAPYGPKSKREIATLIAMALRRLHKAGATEIVSACNSASVSLLQVPIDLLRVGVFDVIEMVEPTVGALVRMNKKTVILGTVATINSGIYQDACRRRGITVDAVALPELAGLIERGALRTEIKREVEKGVVEALQYDVEIISLSCTHYPFVRDVFQECLREAGSSVELFDPAEAVAEAVVSRFTTAGSGELRFLVSKESPVFTATAKELFGTEAYTLELVGSIYSSLKTV